MKIWRCFPPEWGHKLAPLGFSVASHWSSLRNSSQELHCWRPFTWRGLYFNNPIGTAGGLDKDAHMISNLSRLAFGFLEVGTITPEAQSGNPGKVMDRNWQMQALWNKMGFPSEGALNVRENLIREIEKLNTHRPPIFVNIGKNRNTSAEAAAQDYHKCAEILAPLADAFVVNVSSPNTSGLRDLQHGQHLKDILSSVRTFRNPLLLKLSPDLTRTDLDQILNSAIDSSVDGFILTNTTLSRAQNSPFPKEGGVSGAPLATQSEKILEWTIQSLGPQRNGLLIVSTGGILNSKDIQARLEMGADLVQVYSALVFQGPLFAKKAVHELRNTGTKT